LRRLNGQTAHGYAGAVRAGSGATDATFRGRVGYPIHAITSTSDSVYAAGDGPGGHLVAWNTAGAAKFPTVQTDGGAQAVTVIGGEVYVGGHRDKVCTTGLRRNSRGGFDCQGTAVTRRKLLSVDAHTGRLTSWNPGANSPPGVYAMAAVPGGRLAAGGDFTQVHRSTRNHFALFG
jgi:hypothetical protein